MTQIMRDSPHTEALKLEIQRVLESNRELLDRQLSEIATGLLSFLEANSLSFPDS